MDIQLIKLCAGALAFTGCLLAYLASARQRLLRRQLERRSAWGLFGGLQLLACVLLANVYPAVSAVLVVLSLVMFAWIGLVLASSHLAGRPLLVGSVGLILSSLIMVTG